MQKAHNARSIKICQFFDKLKITFGSLACGFWLLAVYLHSKEFQRTSDLGGPRPREKDRKNHGPLLLMTESNQEKGPKKRDLRIVREGTL